MCTMLWSGVSYFCLRWVEKDTLQGKEKCGPVVHELVGKLQYVVCKVRCTFLSGYKFYSFEV
jgi:hypothetical protein